MSSVLYPSRVGSLMYAMVCSRPNLAYAVSMISMFIANPGKQHWEALKWILRYLKGSSEVVLWFGKNKKMQEAIEGYVDSDHAGCIDTRKSLTGLVFTLYGNAMSWKSNLQTVVALSTTEDECIAMTEAIKEGMWLLGIIREMGVKQDCVTIHCDNQSTIHLTKHQLFNERSKHIDVKLHFVRDIVSKGFVVEKKIPIDENPADMFTKSLPVTKFRHCQDLVNSRENK